jgi:hypothetical protein
LLLPELESPEVAESAARIRSAVDSLDLKGADLVVLLTPHGARLSEPEPMGYGFYRDRSGSLAEFGRADLTATARLDEHASARLGELSHWSTRPGPLDHGATVPLRLRDWSPSVAIASFSDLSGDDRPSLDAIYEVARDYAHAIEEIAAQRSVVVVASVNGCAGLSARAPLTETPEAILGEEWLLRTTSSDLGGFGEWQEALELVWKGGSCGIGPLEVLGELFGGRSMEVLAHEAPVGVGYLVAQTT